MQVMRGTRLALRQRMLAVLAALPWLQGFFAPEAVSERETAGVIAELDEWREPRGHCIADSYGGLALRADVAPTDGRERILASYSQGVFVLGRDRHLLAQATGFACEGSSDQLIAIAA